MSTPYTQRVEVGAFYTDGEILIEITEVNPLGYVHWRDTDREVPVRGGAGIDAFRRRFWLAKATA
jgi:hypothetical protein